MEKVKSKIRFRLGTAMIFLITVATLAHIFLGKETGGYFYWSLDYGYEDKRLHLYVLLTEIHYLLCLFCAWWVASRLINLAESSETFKISERDEEGEPINTFVMWLVWIFSLILIPEIAGFGDEELEMQDLIWSCVSICFFILLTTRQYFELYDVNYSAPTPWSKKRGKNGLYFYAPKGADKAECARKAVTKYMERLQE